MVKASPRKHSSINNTDSEGKMEIDNSGSEASIKEKAEAYRALMDPLAASITRVSGSLRGIPSNEDFHFYQNFDEFKAPVKEMAEKSKSMLKTIGSSMNPLGKVLPFPDDSEESYEWLVDRNDEAFEQFDASVDEFKRVRSKEGESGKGGSVFMEEDGFQLVNRRNKKGASYDFEKDEGQNSGVVSSVTMAFKDKKTTGAKTSVPFHIPTIPRPQDEFRIVVNNSNKPFEHVWLQKSEDGSKFIHPLEKLSDLDFVDRNIGEGEPVKPPPLESTPFTLIEEVKELKALAAKLRDVNEFAVDLEHNNYRSFQGMTCLMQISTRTEDFVVDTLKLRVHIGPYLREVFKDPSKRKVLHGADHDIKWLQRDFGIYVCNMFDTGQASRLLQLERNSLEYLLRHFCGVIANKEYQNADWRIRPIPDEMLRYAREDTHYLLHIYDLMKRRLLSASDEGEDLLLEVYKLSRVICMNLYKKDILTDTTYLHIYGLAAADFNSQQLSIVAGLCEWRDLVGRLEDESTGYILPNRTLLEIARQMPLTAAKLRRIVKSKHPHIERNLGAVVSVIRNAVQNADAFEGAVVQLKERAEEALKQSMEVVTDEFEALAVPGDPIDIQATQPEKINGEDCIMENGDEHEEASVLAKEALGLGGSLVQQGTCAQGRSFEISGESVDQNKEQGSNASELSNGSTGVINVVGATCLTKNVPEATVQVLKKPNRAFGALLGNMGSKRKLDPSSKDKAEIKVEQIKSSVTLPFHTFICSNDQLKPPAEESTKAMEVPISREAEVTTNLEEVVPLDGDASNHESSDEDPSTANGELSERVNGGGTSPVSDADDEMSELYAGFESLGSKRKTKNRRQVKISQEPYPELEPYDYATAREEIKFGQVRGESTVAEGEEGLKNSKGGSKERRKKPAATRFPTEEPTQEFQQARRRQAFPQSGNRSSTFR